MNDYIKQVTIKNFQSHKNTALNMDKGVNVIVGLSDNGKSAILRAITWVIRNRSEDKAFRSRWGGKTDVELTFSEGVEVSRVQDSGNQYFLVDENNNVDEEYKAFKTDIPEDVVNALNMDSLNIQAQFDSPFLLSESAGDVGKYFNKIANLTEIDESISNVGKLVRANSSEIATTEAIITTHEKDLESFQFLTQMELDVSDYEALITKEMKINYDIIQINLLIDKTETEQNELSQIATFLKAEPELKAALVLTEEEKALTSQIQALQTLLQKQETLQFDFYECKAIIQAETDCGLALLDYETLRDLDIEIAKLQKLIKDTESNYNALHKYKSDLEIKQTRLKSEMPNVCPLCGK